MHAISDASFSLSLGLQAKIVWSRSYYTYTCLGGNVNDFDHQLFLLSFINAFVIMINCSEIETVLIKEEVNPLWVPNVLSCVFCVCFCCALFYADHWINLWERNLLKC